MVYLGKPNFTGGVDVSINWFNYSKNKVKYITFTLTPFNAVNDIVQCKISKKSSISLKSTGPFENGFQCSPSPGGSWSNVWYNEDISYCVLNKVTIQYFNGKQKIINKLKLKSTSDIQKFVEMMIQNDSFKK